MNFFRLQAQRSMPIRPAEECQAILKLTSMNKLKGDIERSKRVLVGAQPEFWTPSECCIVSDILDLIK